MNVILFLHFTFLLAKRGSWRLNVFYITNDFFSRKTGDNKRSSDNGEYAGCRGVSCILLVVRIVIFE